MTENFANLYSSTLSAAITGTGDTTLTVTSAAGAPSVNFRILIDSEYMLVTNVSSTTFTVTRGIEGSTAAVHSSGQPVTHVLTAGGLSQAISEYATAAWQDYTPSLTASSSNPSVGNGTIAGRYLKMGKTLFLHIDWLPGSTTTNGTGNYSISLPSGITSASLGSNRNQTISGYYFQSGVAHRRAVAIVKDNSTKLDELYLEDSTTHQWASDNFGFSNGSRLNMNGVIEIQ